MKTIDWTKPILVNNAKGRVLSVFKGSAFVTWNDELFATSFDEQGRRYGRSYPEVTNVPEEPADTICLYRSGDKWFINQAGIRGNPWDQKQVAPRSYWGDLPGYVYVKVPV